MQNQYRFVDIGDMMIEILSNEKSHKYLGRNINLFAEHRTECEVNHRLQLAWAKFHQNRKWLLDHHIPLSLRLRFFDAVVSPTAVFAGSVLSFKKSDFSKIDIVQRRMLRNIIGWRRRAGETWETTMHFMKIRLENALKAFPVACWSDRIFGMRWKYAFHVIHNEKMVFPRLLADWVPTNAAGEIPRRKQGRPRVRWDDDLFFYCKEELELAHWLDLRRFSKGELDGMEKDFILYCQE